MSELALRKGDVRAADRLIGEFGDAEVGATEHLTVMSKCVDPARGELNWEAEVEASAQDVLWAAVNLGVTGAYPGCAIGGFRALWDYADVFYSWSALLGLQSTYLATGRHEDARAAISSAQQFERQQRYLFVAGAIAGAPFTEEAEASVLRLERDNDPSATTLWAVGAWNALAGRPDRVSVAVTSAGERITANGATLPSDTLLVEVLNAWQALALADTTLAIDRLQALAPVDAPLDLAWGVWESLGAERMILARLLMARGDYAAAMRIAEYLDHPEIVIYIAYLPVSLELRAQAAEALGRASLAEEYRSRLNQLQRAPLEGAP